MTATDEQIRSLRCAEPSCGRPAICIGRYEDMKHDEPACDGCCAHGCEDGHCQYLVDEDGGVDDDCRQRVAEHLTRTKS